MILLKKKFYCLLREIDFYDVFESSWNSFMILKTIIGESLIKNSTKRAVNAVNEETTEAFIEFNGADTSDKEIERKSRCNEGSFQLV